MNEPRRWQELAAEAAGAEIEAMHLHQAGSLPEAAEAYRRVLHKLHEAAGSVKEDDDIRCLLEQRAEEASKRVASLEGSNGRSSCVVQESVNFTKIVTEGILASTLASTAGDPDGSVGKAQTQENTKIFGAAAAMGGAAGLLLMGPVSAAALGATAAYATMREDRAGQAMRKVSSMSLKMADKAVDAGLEAADLALEEGKKRLKDGIDGKAPGKIGEFCSNNKDKCRKTVAAVEKLQGVLPRRKLCEEARRMRTRYPDRIPVFCDKAPGSELPAIERKKFAVLGDMTVGSFKYIIHNQVSQASNVARDQTIYVFVGASGTSPKTSTTMAELYEQHRADDGFLYIYFDAENTLGETSCDLCE
jgi:GABA(A) receptor-associated protein